LTVSDGEEETTFLVESLEAVICPRQYSSSYGIDVRSLAITDTKAWHIFIDCVVPPPSRDFVDEILSSDTPQPIDSLSLAVRVALQTTLLPHITLEDVPTDHTYEERASLMDMAKGRVPHDQKVFQVDDDWVPPFSPSQRQPNLFARKTQSL
jgi:exosome complex RNA-binding protein Rrp42 (RNase PH superfamily)